MNAELRALIGGARSRRSLLLTLCAASILPSSLVRAQTFPVEVIGVIQEVWADPSDVVIGFNQNGLCGSNIFDVKRGTTNFAEVVSLMYTASASGKRVDIYVSGCENGTRNVVDHAAMLTN